jgi:hypothetical protein
MDMESSEDPTTTNLSRRDDLRQQSYELIGDYNVLRGVLGDNTTLKDYRNTARLRNLDCAHLHVLLKCLSPSPSTIDAEKVASDNMGLKRVLAAVKEDHEEIMACVGGPLHPQRQSSASPRCPIAN